MFRYRDFQLRSFPCSLWVCPLFQVSERMKIVDVIGEKVYKDGERIITQVSRSLCSAFLENHLLKDGYIPCPLTLVGAHVASCWDTLPTESFEAHWRSSRGHMPISCLHFPFAGFLYLFFWTSFCSNP